MGLGLGLDLGWGCVGFGVELGLGWGLNLDLNNPFARWLGGWVVVVAGPSRETIKPTLAQPTCFSHRAECGKKFPS